MARKSHPLELILRAHGPAELVNSENDTIWVSDSDDDFREEFNDEFLMEEDIGDVLEYLLDMGIINDFEFQKFESDAWDCTIETVDNVTEGPEDDDEDDGDDDG